MSPHERGSGITWNNRPRQRPACMAAPRSVSSTFSVILSSSREIIGRQSREARRSWLMAVLERSRSFRDPWKAQCVGSPKPQAFTLSLSKSHTTHGRPQKRLLASNGLIDPDRARTKCSLTADAARFNSVEQRVVRQVTRLLSCARATSGGPCLKTGVMSSTLLSRTGRPWALPA